MRPERFSVILWRIHYHPRNAHFRGCERATIDRSSVPLEMFRWNFLCFSPRISTSSVDYGEFTAGAIQSSRFQLQYSKTKLENRGVDQWLCWRQQNSSLLLAVSKCRDVLAKCFYIRDIFKPTATAHIQIIVQEKTTKTQNIPVPLWILLICLTIVIAQSPLPPSLPLFPLARVKILKNFCVRTPRRSVGSLNATVSVIDIDTVYLIL